MRVNKQTGYTILEVLIFLAVSSLMFVSAMRAISGRQNQVQFAQSVKEFDAKLKDVINDVTTSYYPTNKTVDCLISAGGDVVIDDATNEALGTDDDCIYVGKVIHFQINNNNTAMKIFAMAGKRYADGNLTPSLSVKDARPKAVSMPGNASFTESAEDFITLYGLKVTRVIRPVSATIFTDYGSLAIMSNFGGSSISEAQSVLIGGIKGSFKGGDTTSALTAINQLTDDPAKATLTGYFEKNTDEGIVICLESPEGKKASISLGIKGSSTTTLSIDNYNVGCV